MVGIKLNTISDLSKFRDECLQKSHLKHFIEGLKSAHAIQNSLEAVHIFTGFPEGIVHKKKKFPDQSSRFHGQRTSGAGRFLKYG